MMSHSYLTSYERIRGNDDAATSGYGEPSDADASPENFPHLLIHVVPQSDKTRWNHIEDLDSFFTRVYQYHQQNGFFCMMVKQFFYLFNFAFVTLFTTFLFTSVDYEILFRNKKLPGDPDKITISDCILPFSQVWQNMSASIVMLLIAAFGFWLLRFFIAIINYFKFCDIKKFYNVALGITDDNLVNVAWADVQQRLMEVQVEQRMCIHKEVLTELDIYHRILRFDNYLIAMVNKNIIPIQRELPLIGNFVFLTRGLRYNIELILFYGVGAPFLNNWQVKDEFKRAENRHRLAEELSRRIFYVGLANFVLFPLILLFQILRSFFHYTDIIKREPGFLGIRMWSHYGEVSLRHYNELEHELRARLNRAYRSASQYLNSFTSALAAVVARHVAFICGAVLAVLAVLTIYDEDVIQVEHVITVMTFLAAVTAFCRVLIPKENLVWCPEVLMTKVLSEVHYLPDSWKGKAHTYAVRTGFSQLFQYKFVHLIESLLSPLVTPAILCFGLRHKSLEIVDFLRNFTVEVVGVGDICSFAQMDLRRHGSRTWHPNVDLAMDESLEPHETGLGLTDGGKTELSLLHFTLTNPAWKPPEESSVFLDAIRAQARRDFNALPTLEEEDNALYDSVTSAGMGDVLPLMATSTNIMHQSRRFRTTGQYSGVNCGPVNHLEGSMHITSSGVLGSLSQGPTTEHANERSANAFAQPPRIVERDPLSDYRLPIRPQDLVAIDMSVSTLYLHELHRRFQTARNYTDNPVRVNHPPGGGQKSGSSTMRLPVTESYYHPTDTPSTEASSYFPPQSQWQRQDLGARSSQTPEEKESPLLDISP